MVYKGLLDDREIERAMPVFQDIHRLSKVSGQTGVNGGRWLTRLIPRCIRIMEELASSEMGCWAKLIPRRSSFRIQGPYGGLAPHQDWPALGLTTYGQRGLTVWVPLTRIEPYSHALGICGSPPGMFLPHVTDPSGYSVLPQDTRFVNVPAIYPVRDLRVGDCISFPPDTIHGTILGESPSSRMSLDLRFRPTRWSRIKTWLGL